MKVSGLLVFSAPKFPMDMKERHEEAKRLGYTMFTHNAYVYSTSDCAKLFKIVEL